MASALIQDAVIRNFEIVGEAAKRVSADVRQAFPEVPWNRIAGFRDVLIHNYPGVDLAEVWNVIEAEALRLKRQIQAVLEALGNPKRCQ